MRTITDEELQDILAKHKKWLNDKEGGEQADLSNVNLRKFNLRDVDLSYTDLRGSNLFWANLKGANLQGADLRYARLAEADLLYANLREANLQYVNLQRADLRYADLRYVDLQNVDLRGADLRYTYLMGANLNYHNLAWSDVRYAVRPWLLTISNIGSRKTETLYFADKDNVLCGCWNNYRGGTLTEFKLRIDEVYPADSENEMHRKYRREYLRAIEIFELVREVYMREVYLESAVEKKSNE